MYLPIVQRVKLNKAGLGRTRIGSGARIYILPSSVYNGHSSSLISYIRTIDRCSHCTKHGEASLACQLYGLITLFFSGGTVIPHHIHIWPKFSYLSPIKDDQSLNCNGSELINGALLNRSSSLTLYYVLIYFR